MSLKIGPQIKSNQILNPPPPTPPLPPPPYLPPYLQSRGQGRLRAIYGQQSGCSRVEVPHQAAHNKTRRLDVTVGVHQVWTVLQTSLSPGAVYVWSMNSAEVRVNPCQTRRSGNKQT